MSKSSLWVRIKAQTTMGDSIVGDCYRLPEGQEETVEVLYRQLKLASQSQTLVVMENFNHLDICWRNHTVRHKQPSRFLEGTDNNFLGLVVKKPARKGVLLDLYYQTQNVWLEM